MSMLGRYELRGMGATRSEWADRIRISGFSVAGIALTVAGVLFFWPAIKTALFARKVKKTYSKGKKALGMSKNPQTIKKENKKVGGKKYAR